MDTLAPGLVLIVFGVLTMFGSVLNWHFITHSGKLFNMIFGDTAARVIYFGIGIFLFVKGIEFLIGANWF